MSEKEFVLRHELKNVENFKEGEFYNTEWEEKYHVGWRVNIRKTGEELRFYLNADLQEGSKQSALVEYKLCIIRDNGEVLSRGTRKNLFEPGIPGDFWGWFDFTDWKNVMDNCLIDGNLKVEAHVTILEMNGFTREKVRSFGEDVKQFSDVALVVNEEKFYVSKLYLSTHSPFFATLFLGPFQESGKAEVQLKDVKPTDLQCFLEVLYGDSNDTVDGILSLAGMYDTQNVVRKCEKFLLEKSEKSLKEKLQLAGKHRLGELKNSCMEKIKSVADIRSVTPSDPKEMGLELLSELYQKLLAFH